MKHLQKAPRKPLFFNEKQGNVFLSLFDDLTEKRIAKHLFIDGLTNEETGSNIGYSTRQIERIRKNLLKVALKMLVEMRTPKKAIKHGFDPNKLISTVHYTCPMCNEHIGRDRYCKHCGQALDWSEDQ